jgi:hypothetical protein
VLHLAAPDAVALESVEDQGRARGRRQIGRDVEPGDRLAHELVARVAEHDARGLVGVEDLAVVGPDEITASAMCSAIALWKRSSSLRARRSVTS